LWKLAGRSKTGYSLPCIRYKRRQTRVILLEQGLMVISITSISINLSIFLLIVELSSSATTPEILVGIY
jgi:hypothetical protein